MSFGSKRLDDSFDRWVTQTPEEYYGTEDEDEEDATFDCCVCGAEECEGYGNNPDPVKKKGRCCDVCNTTKVIPARITSLSTTKKVDRRRV